MKSNRIPVLIFILLLAFSTLACGATSVAAEPTEPPAQPAVTELPVGASAGNETGSSTVVPCSQLIPADELSLLLSHASASLKENVFPSGTSCEWKYVPNGGTQENLLYLQASSTNGDTSLWEGMRTSELSDEPSDIVVNSMDGLGDESYTWVSKTTGQRVVYVRKGDKTLVMRFNPQDILFMANESGIIDMADRIFDRF